MNLQQKTRRFGAWVILCSLLLRIQPLITVEKAASFLSQPHIASVLLYLETGRHVRFSLPFGQGHTAESAAPWSAPESLPVFAPEQANAVQMYYGCDLRPDLTRLMAQPLQWYLPLPEPTVLILHSHGTEGYSDTRTSDYRTTEETRNMLSIGDRVVEVLAEYGITALHDRTLHDYPNYNTAYAVLLSASCFPER